MRNQYANRQAETAVVTPDDPRRCCAWCGDFIDPIDWCTNCQTNQAPCGTHTRLRKRADAAFCDSGCRSAFHSDTGPKSRSRGNWWG